MRTGYFSRATEEGHIAKFTQVHIVYHNNKLLCRYRPHPTMKFQWCSGGVNLSYVECKKCKERYKKLLNKIAKEIE